MPAGWVTLLTIALRYEHDVVSARQRTRQIAALLGFDRQDQTRLTTAVSEIVRNACEYARGGRVEFLIDSPSPQTLCVRVIDQGPGIPHLREVLEGRYVSRSGMGLGITGARRLVDRSRFESRPGEGTTVELEKDLPRRRLGEAPLPSVAQITQALTLHAPQDPFEELQWQNQELARVLDDLQQRQAELDQLNRELSDTNRGVMALYAELDEKAKELQRASEMKTTFLSNMSHEFRTPLNSIMGLARLLLSYADGPLTSEQEKQVTFIYRSAQALAEVVNDLLDTAKIEAGKVSVQAQEFSVEDLLSSLRGVFRPLVGDTGGVELVIEACPDLPALYTDEAKVAQILRNLISNALKFTERGSVRLSTMVDNEDGRITFTITDTGIGIAPGDQTRIFEDFAQVQGAVQRRVKGTGLGLPLSRRLAELLGGGITLQSQVGEGSTFRLTIPTHYQGPAEIDIVQGLGI